MSGFNFVNKSSNQSDISKKLGNHFTSSSNTPFKNASINTKKNAQNSMLEKDLLPQKNLTETKNEFKNFSSSQKIMLALTNSIKKTGHKKILFGDDHLSPNIYFNQNQFRSYDYTDKKNLRAFDSNNQSLITDRPQLPKNHKSSELKQNSKMFSGTLEKPLIHSRQSSIDYSILNFNYMNNYTKQKDSQMSEDANKKSKNYNDKFSKTIDFANVASKPTKHVTQNHSMDKDKLSSKEVFMNKEQTLNLN